MNGHPCAPAGMVSASGTTVPSTRHGLRWLKRGLSYLLLAYLRILDLA